MHIQKIDHRYPSHPETTSPHQTPTMFRSFMKRRVALAEAGQRVPGLLLGRQS
jgi:hypothetical protein